MFTTLSGVSLSANKSQSLTSLLDTATNSNVYISKLPVSVDETTLTKVFGQYGTIECCRVQRNPQNTSGRTFGFVKFRTSIEAHRAIDGMNGALMNDSPIEVKLADQDPGEKVNGGTPSDNLYVRNLPNSWGTEEMTSLFSQFGTVMTCRLLHAGEGIRGGGGLVRMSSIADASEAIAGLNGRIPQGGSEMLFVRYADTPEEKARRKSKRNTVQYRFSPYQNTGTPSPNHASTRPLIPDQVFTVDPTTHQVGQYPSNWPTEVSNGSFATTVTTPQSGYSSVFTPATPVQVTYQTQHQTCSIYIKNLPPSTDKLFLYEKFARFGAITSVKPMPDEVTGRCKGFGFVNYTTSNAAQLAVDSMNGALVGDKVLHVSLQSAKIAI